MLTNRIDKHTCLQILNYSSFCKNTFYFSMPSPILYQWTLEQTV